MKHYFLINKSNEFLRLTQLDCGVVENYFLPTFKLIKNREKDEIKEDNEEFDLYFVIYGKFVCSIYTMY